MGVSFKHYGGLSTCLAGYVHTVLVAAESQLGED